MQGGFVVYVKICNKYMQIAQFFCSDILYIYVRHNAKHNQQILNKHRF